MQRQTTGKQATPRQSILSNGTTIILEPVADSEVSAIGFWFLHGSRDESPGEIGFSHFLEHMIFKGTKKRSPRDIACEIDRVGGSINAGTEKEITAVYTSVPKDFLPVVLDVMCDIAFASELPDSEIEKEKLVVANEISSIEDSPEEKGFELFLESIWKDHPLSWKIAGTIPSIKAVTREKLSHFYRKHFTPPRLVVSAAGAIDPPALCAQIERKIAEYAVNKADSGLGPLRRPPRFHAGTGVLEDTFTQTQIYYARPLPRPLETRDYYEQLLLSSAFGESMSSRLFQKIREEEGLCYSIYSSRAYYSDTALWMVYASTMPDLLPRLLDSLARELRRLADEPLSQKEIDDARLQVKGSLILARQDAEVRMKRLARQHIAMGKILDHDECFGIIDAITRQDLERQIERLFSNDDAALFVYGTRKLKIIKADRLQRDFRIV